MGAGSGRHLPASYRSPTGRGKSSSGARSDAVPLTMFVSLLSRVPLECPRAGLRAEHPAGQALAALKLGCGKEETAAAALARMRLRGLCPAGPLQCLPGPVREPGHLRAEGASGRRGSGLVGNPSCRRPLSTPPSNQRASGRLRLSSFGRPPVDPRETRVGGSKVGQLTDASPGDAREAETPSESPEKAAVMPPAPPVLKRESGSGIVAA